MDKRKKALVFTIAGVILLGGAAAIAAPVIYRDFIASPAADSPALSADDTALTKTAGETLDPAHFSGEWKTAEGSYAGYRVDEVLNGSPVTVTGRTKQVTGSLTLEGQTVSQADFSVDIASIATDSSSRDNYFRTSVMNATEHPSATFTLTGPVTLATVPKSGEVVHQELSGNLTLAGATRPVTFTAQLRADAAAKEGAPSTIEIAGQIPITFADFGITAPSLGFVSVEPTGLIEVNMTMHGPDAQ